MNLHTFFISKGFRSLATEPCLYTLKDREGPVMIAVYVDDLIIAAPSRARVDDIEKMFKGKYSMKPEEELKFVLDIKLSRDRIRRQIDLLIT